MKRVWTGEGSLIECAEFNSAAWALKSGSHDLTSGRLLLVRLLLTWLSKTKPSVELGQLRTLLEQPELPLHGNIATKWDVVDVVDSFQLKLSLEQLNLAAALVEALNDRSTVQRLEAFPKWRDQPAVALDVSWPDLPMPTQMPLES